MLNHISKLPKLVIALFLGGLGGIANLLPIWFLDSSEFLFGQLFVILCLLALGWQYAVLAVGIGAMFLLYRWGHCLPSVVFLIEILWLQVFCVRANKPLFIRGLGFWVLFGIPILFIMGKFVLGLTLLVIFTALAKYMINAAVYLAIVDLTSLFLFKRVWQAKSLYQILNYMISHLIILVVLITTIVLTNSHYKRIEFEVTAQLHDASVSALKQIDDYLESYRRAINIAAQDIQSGVDKQQVINRLVDTYPNFRTAIVADQSAFVTHFYPDALKTSLVGEVPSVADREYFIQAPYYPNGYVSGIFQGRGFGNDPVVAVSAPLYEDGEFQGIVESSLFFESFEQFIPKVLAQKGHLLIVDHENNIVFSSLKSDFNILDNVANEQLIALTESTDQVFISNNRDVYYRQSVQSDIFNWRVISLIERKHVNLAVASAWIQSFVLALFIIAISSFLVNRMTRVFTKPIVDLSHSINSFDPNEKMSEVSNTAEGSCLEVITLQQQFSQLAFKLSTSFAKLNSANEENEQLNRKLKDFNKHLEQEVSEKTEELIKALEQANKASSAKSQFLANMSHEIRTPLNGIIGMSDELINNEFDAESKAQLDIIHQSAHKLLLILNDILDYSKIEAGALELSMHNTDVSDFVVAISTAFEKSLSKPNVEFNHTLDEQVPKVLIFDDLRLSQVINNLLSNAGKFTEHGQIDFTVDYYQGSLRLKVKDTGIGIAKSAQKDLFDEFTQADLSTTRKYGGTGLGLTICKRLVALMGGQLRFQSTENVGSEFTVEIPAELGEQPKLKSVSADIPNLENVKILLVEDNPINQIVATQFLEKTGCFISKAMDGIEALKALEEQRFDIILMDCQMPNMDGFECTRTIRQSPSTYGCPYIIAITANAFAEDKEKCLQAGMDDFVAKPIESITLYSCLKSWNSIDKNESDEK
ncbi:response regulator [Pseudoalteromonas luteoviolacea]|uniref:response regulator n=1 Tax=Pseudoalteromonas luteoviolacea TaxID=43657 RepID=UPI001B3589EE|nr:response regulator [Pseudoalteromonas luteoviolacea]MBQ4810769.1 response regulator [Pseudoalteromonas luteoviolacea]